jgi:hypothetical protein
MNTRDYVKSLFKDYEESPGLAEFTEELQSNLDARIASLEQRGLSKNAAFDKAAAELGDISILAGEMSLKKRREVFQEAYLGIRSYMKLPRILCYVFFGTLTAFGALIAAIAWFSAGSEALYGSLVVFELSGLAGLVFMGLTQETSAREGMPWKRALWYTLAVSSLFFGILTSFLLLLKEHNPIAALGTLIPFGLPGFSLIIFLILSEKDRNKAWVKALKERRFEKSGA